MQQDYSRLTPHVPSPRRRHIGFFYIIPIGLTIGFFIFSGVQVFRAVSGKPLATSPSPTPARRQAVVTPTAIPTPIAVLPKDNKTPVLVLNGSGKKGVAAGMREVLEEAGYTNVSIGNASRSDYTAITIRTTEAGTKEAEALEEILEKSDTVNKIETVASVAAGIVLEVVVGKK